MQPDILLPFRDFRRPRSVRGPGVVAGDGYAAQRWQPAPAGGVSHGAGRLVNGVADDGVGEP